MEGWFPEGEDGQELGSCHLTLAGGWVTTTPPPPHTPCHLHLVQVFVHCPPSLDGGFKTPLFCLCFWEDQRYSTALHQMTHLPRLRAPRPWHIPMPRDFSTSATHRLRFPPFQLLLWILQSVKISPKARGKIRLLGSQCSWFALAFQVPLPLENPGCTPHQIPPSPPPATLFHFTQWTFGFLILPSFHLPAACLIPPRIIHDFIEIIAHLRNKSQISVAAS